MSFSKVQAFVKDAKTAKSYEMLAASMSDVSKDVGFDNFALIYAPRVNASPADFVQLTTYPEEWVNVVKSRAYWMDDPIFVACEHANAGFEWTHLSDIIRINDRQQSMMEKAGNFGLKNGFTVPIPRCGNIVSLCSFSVANEQEVEAVSAVAAQAIGWFAHEAVCRLNERMLAPRLENIRLTPRQVDCMVLFARGKSDAAIGQILGISRRTANEHIENAKRRFNVSTRQQLLSRALWHGQLSFADIL